MNAVAGTATGLTTVSFAPTLDGFRSAVRPLLAGRVPPDGLLWEPTGQGQKSLFAPAVASATPGAPVPLPGRFLSLAGDVALHRDPERWPRLYSVAFRLLTTAPHLLDDAADPDLLRLQRMADQVRRDVHKVHAFVRFRRVVEGNGERFVAFHRPDHFVLPAAVDLFVERFAGMRWSILTPDASAHWNGRELTFGPGVSAREAPDRDELEALWGTYYASIYNPARINLKAMIREVPRRHFATLPELRALPSLIADAGGRVQSMLSDPLAAPQRPVIQPGASLPVLAQAARGCAACPHAAHATGTVFGEGPADAALVLVGEQPGDEEDRHGRPFIGPAGQLLDRALVAAGIDRRAIYVTNAVKHFKFTSDPRGKRRLHAKPRGREVEVCRPWLEAELAAVRPRVVLALGATAGHALFGPRTSPRKHRGQPLPTPLATLGLVTYHPSAILRAPTPGEAAVLEAALVEDLRRAREAAEHRAIPRVEP